MPRRTGRLTFWVLQGFSCLLMKHFQLKPLVSKDFAIAKCQTTPRETDNTNFLSFAVLDLETIHNTFFFAYRRQKKHQGVELHLQKNSGMVLFFWIPNIFFGSKLATRKALLGWKWLQYCTIPLPQRENCNSLSTERV